MVKAGVFVYEVELYEALDVLRALGTGMH